MYERCKLSATGWLAVTRTQEDADKTYPLALLCARRQRPRRRTAE
jgi:hypothetical protein